MPTTDSKAVGRWLVLHRRYLGLAAAFAHTVQFGYIVLYTGASADGIDPVTLVAAGGAFVFLWLMALSSNDFAVRRLGRWWKRLHRVGIHYLWVVFVYTFGGIALFAPWYWSFVAVGIAGLLLRVIARRSMSQHASVGEGA
jgi:DMSO/TMAO reductase YedYZ heme-binding membrane subunit